MFKDLAAELTEPSAHSCPDVACPWQIREAGMCMTVKAAIDRATHGLVPMSLLVHRQGVEWLPGQAEACSENGNQHSLGLVLSLAQDMAALVLGSTKGALHLV